MSENLKGGFFLTHTVSHPILCTTDEWCTCTHQWMVYLYSSCFTYHGQYCM